MKKFLSIFALVIVLLSCSKDSRQNNNPYLPTYKFTSNTINLTLPLYSNLQNPGNAIEYSEISVGIRDKVFILNMGSGNFLAWDAALPKSSLECLFYDDTKRNKSRLPL